MGGALLKKGTISSGKVTFHVSTRELQSGGTLFVAVTQRVISEQNYGCEIKTFSFEFFFTNSPYWVEEKHFDFRALE